jgi:hypothetical protein
VQVLMVVVAWRLLRGQDDEDGSAVVDALS